MEETVENVSLENGGRLSDLLQELCELRLTGSFCDVVVEVQSRRYLAHKAVLSSTCRYFRSLFLAEPCSTLGPFVLDFISVETFEQVLEFIYRGQLSVPRTDLSRLRVAATALGIHCLQEALPPPSSPASESPDDDDDDEDDDDDRATNGPSNLTEGPSERMSGPSDSEGPSVTASSHILEDGSIVHSLSNIHNSSASYGKGKGWLSGMLVGESSLQSRLLKPSATHNGTDNGTEQGDSGKLIEKHEEKPQIWTVKQEPMEENDEGSSVSDERQRVAGDGSLQNSRTDEENLESLPTSQFSTIYVQCVRSLASGRMAPRSPRAEVPGLSCRACGLALDEAAVVEGFCRSCGALWDDGGPPSGVWTSRKGTSEPVLEGVSGDDEMGWSSVVCKTCGLTIPSSTAAVRRHARVHVDRSLRSCLVCGKRFNDRSNVVRHALLHIGAPIFACELCHRRFTTRNHVVQHQRQGCRTRGLMQPSLSSSPILDLTHSSPSITTVELPLSPM
uniref:zinc finger and BTB domain-containing protein 39-like n=1 Tax=Myxine glutinosa TaxID=7769 RepID=UPI00358FBB22